jgi:hypothetical protein
MSIPMFYGPPVNSIRPSVNPIPNVPTDKVSRFVHALLGDEVSVLNTSSQFGKIFIDVGADKVYKVQEYDSFLYDDELQFSKRSIYEFNMHKHVYNRIRSPKPLDLKFYRWKGSLFSVFTMKPLRMSTLDKILRTKLPSTILKNIVVAIQYLIDDLAFNGIVHGDLHWGNISLRPRGGRGVPLSGTVEDMLAHPKQAYNPVLLDFGYSTFDNWDTFPLEILQLLRTLYNGSFHSDNITILTSMISRWLVESGYEDLLEKISTDGVLDTVKVAREYDRIVLEYSERLNRTRKRPSYDRHTQYFRALSHKDIVPIMGVDRMLRYFKDKRTEKEYIGLINPMTVKDPGTRLKELLKELSSIPLLIIPEFIVLNERGGRVYILIDSFDLPTLHYYMKQKLSDREIDRVLSVITNLIHSFCESDLRHGRLRWQDIAVFNQDPLARLMSKKEFVFPFTPILLNFNVDTNTFCDPTLEILQFLDSLHTEREFRPDNIRRMHTYLMSILKRNDLYTYNKIHKRTMGSTIKAIGRLVRQLRKHYE